MATLNNIVDDNLFLLRSLKVTQSELLQRRQMEYHVHNNRALMVQRDIQRKREMSDQYFQTIDCLEMEVADMSECCSVPSNCKVLKSVNEIPDYISEDYFSVIMGQRKIIQLTTPDRAIFNQYRKYVDRDPLAYIKNKHLYVINEKFLRYIGIRNIFVNPMDLASFISCSGNSCYTQDSEYPIPADKIPYLNSLILKEFGIIYSIKPDDINDASNQAQGVIKPSQIQADEQ